MIARDFTKRKFQLFNARRAEPSRF